MSDSTKPIRSKDIQLWKRKPPTSSRIPQGRQLSELEQALRATRAEIGQAFDSAVEQALRRFAKRLQDDQEVA